MSAATSKDVSVGKKAASVLEKYAPKLEPWGVSVLVDSEMDALLVGYAYRYGKYGYTIKSCPNVGKWLVTIWNEKAKEMGFDC